ncbi:MAG: hypothetical protein VYD87_13655 [Pseudomonadota bacterium]|nr:hypothetical protein [Pseudomonadota bacterium]
MDVMHTSALSLREILNVASASKENKSNFLQVVAEHLALRGLGARSQVVSILVSRLLEIKADIEVLPVSEEMKDHLRVQLRPFNAILNFQHLHMSIEQAKAHFLKPESLVGLMNIHLALTGHVVRTVLESSDAESLAESFRVIARQIESEDLPESLRRSLLKRTYQMASILDHYYAFGPDDLQEELEGLVGAMVVSPPPQGSKVAKIYRDLATLAVAGLGLLAAVDTSLGKVVSITENASKLVEYVDDAGPSGEGRNPMSVGES